MKYPNGIRRARLRLGWSQTELARRMTEMFGEEISRQTVWKHETGARGLSRGWVEKYALALGETPAKIAFDRYDAVREAAESDDTQVARLLSDGKEILTELLGKRGSKLQLMTVDSDDVKSYVKRGEKVIVDRAFTRHFSKGVYALNEDGNVVWRILDPKGSKRDKVRVSTNNRSEPAVTVARDELDIIGRAMLKIIPI